MKAEVCESEAKIKMWNSLTKVLDLVAVLIKEATIKVKESK